MTKFQNRIFILLLQNLILKLEMNRIFFFIGLFLIEKELSILPSTNKQVIYLPMKKDHKYGDDICYYREIDEKLDYAVYYVKPCEKGKYCENEDTGRPFGFCRDITTNATDFPSYGNSCSNTGECQNDLICDSTCKMECTGKKDNRLDILFQHNLNAFACENYDYRVLDEKYCKWTDYKFNDNYPQYYKDNNPLDPDETTYGKFPGFPKECGIINYKGFTDYDMSSPISGSSPASYRSYTRYLEESREWCSIGEAEDGVFVLDKKFCKSGFTLNFYRNGDLSKPLAKDDSGNIIYNGGSLAKMCVTPTQIDYNNPLVNGCVITYKGKDGNEHKYYANKYSINCNTDSDYNEEPVMKSQLYAEFIEEFNKASDEDKKNCYKIPDGTVGNCENINLLKLYYFYNNINDYLFYKDRKDLEKVLHFKIQQDYPRYYELSTCLNLNYLFFLLILILL